MQLTESQQRDLIKARQLLAETQEASNSGALYRDMATVRRQLTRMEFAVEQLLRIIDPDGGS